WRVPFSTRRPSVLAPLIGSSTIAMRTTRWPFASTATFTQPWGHYRGDPRAADRALVECLALAHTVGDERTGAFSHLWSAVAAYMQHDFERSEASLLQAWQGFNAAGDRAGVASTETPPRSAGRGARRSRYCRGAARTQPPDNA